jgi:hypothetical protein
MRRLLSALLVILFLAMDANAADPLTLMKTMDGFRKQVPEPQGINEENGKTIQDPNGNDFTTTRLAGVAQRLEVKDHSECLVLLSYLNDPDPKIRYIAACAIDNVVHAFPEGLIATTKLESQDHYEMIRRFAEKLSGGGENTRLLLARSAARAFCTKFDFPAEKIAKLSEPPLLGPATFQRGGMNVVSYRWLGAGRGADIVQVELQGNGQIIVRGGSGHKELGPWEYVP